MQDGGTPVGQPCAKTSIDSVLTQSAASAHTLKMVYDRFLFFLFSLQE